MVPFGVFSLASLLTDFTSNNELELNTKRTTTLAGNAGILKPAWSCSVHDQLSWCVYENSLCVDRDGNIFLITDDFAKHGKNIDLLNDIEPSPWHIPDVHNLEHTSFGKYDIPYRSFFRTAIYVPRQPAGSVHVSGWSLVAAFDSDNYNIYHYMNKLHAAFVARLYHLIGINDQAGDSSVSMLEKLYTPDFEFTEAYLLRPSPTSWQESYSKLCLGNETTFNYLRSTSLELNGSTDTMCFERAIIPGAALYLADGLITSILFREHAAKFMGIRVPEGERNVITIFDRSAGNRRIFNLGHLKSSIERQAANFDVIVVDWDGSVDFREQAMHMARTRIMLTTHGSVLNHNAFMEVEGVVIELNGYQFTYPLGEQAVLSRGNYYLRYEETLENTKFQDQEWGQDPFRSLTSRACMRNNECLLTRRDADIRVDLTRFAAHFERALSLVT